MLHESVRIGGKGNCGASRTWINCASSDILSIHVASHSFCGRQRLSSRATAPLPGGVCVPTDHACPAIANFVCALARSSPQSHTNPTPSIDRPIDLIRFDPIRFDSFDWPQGADRPTHAVSTIITLPHPPRHVLLEAEAGWPCCPYCKGQWGGSGQNQPRHPVTDWIDDTRTPHTHHTGAVELQREDAALERGETLLRASQRHAAIIPSYR